MFQSWNTIPRVTEVMLVDMSATVAFREAMQGQWEQQYGQRISLNDMMTKAVAVALKRHPRLNATLVGAGSTLTRCRQYRRGGQSGRRADCPGHCPCRAEGSRANCPRKSCPGRKSRAGRLQLDDMSDGTFTITNLGTTGIDLFTPIINPPQVAILGSAWYSGARSWWAMPWPFGHRCISAWCLITGPSMACHVQTFLQELQHLLEKPQEYAL